MKTKRNFLLLLSLLGTFSFTACDDEVFGIKGKGELIEEKRSVEAYNEIAIAVSGDVFITQGPQEEIRIVAQENIQDNMIVRVRDNKLTIKFDDHVRNHDGIRIYLSTPTVYDISLSGSGEIFGQNKIVTESLSVSISGSGDVDLHVDTEALTTSISGSGKCYYTGNADGHTIRISGSGDVEAFNLISHQAEVRISGSGKAKLQVTDDLEATISGSGDVIYKGNPTVTTRISGSGSVRKQN